jgi:hypothetical protein
MKRPAEPRITSLEALLAEMAERGSSVTLNWGEDNGMWECSFITGGERYTTFSRHPFHAAVGAQELAIRAAQAATGRPT